MVTPLISVIIPCYNSESTLMYAAYSVLEQPQAKQLELILIDDGSTDGSAKLMDTLVYTHNNVRVFHKLNEGVSSARNLGIDHAKGKYVAFLDSDDWWQRDFLTDDLVKELSKVQSSYLYAFSYQKVSPTKKWIKPIRVRNGVNIYEKPSLSHRISQHHSAFLYRLTYLREYDFRYLPTSVWEDVPFSQLCCSFAKSITCIDRIIFSYYMNYNSCMHTKNSVNKFMEHYRAENLVKGIYESNGLSYEIDRIIISLIGENLKYISIENTYCYVKKLIDSTEFELLNNSDIQPWWYLQKDVQLWRNHPLLAYAKCKISGIPILIKRSLISWKLIRPIAEFIQYRLIEKWIETL